MKLGTWREEQRTEAEERAFAEAIFFVRRGGSGFWLVDKGNGFLKRE